MGEVDPIFLIIAHSIMVGEEFLLVPDTIEFRRAIRDFFAGGLAHSTTSLNIDASSHELTKVQLNLVLPYFDKNEGELVTEITKEFDKEIININRFTGIEVNE